MNLGKISQGSGGTVAKVLTSTSHVQKLNSLSAGRIDQINEMFGINLLNEIEHKPKCQCVTFY